MNKPNLLIFTDLDGTLLDHYTYSWQEAEEALQQLFFLSVPLIFCTSKTKDESIAIRGELGVDHPFIVENGAAIYSPLGYFENAIFNRTDCGYEVKQFGVPYIKLCSFLTDCKKNLHIRLQGFGDLSTGEIQELTGLSFYQAELSRRRNYSEPFRFPDEDSEKRLPELEKAAAERNLKITKGGRFFHLSGPHDKGLAVRSLIDFYRGNEPGDWISVGIGDSLNDLAMLQNVQIPCLVKNAKNRYNVGITRQLSPKLAGDTGPAGWNKIVLQILREYNLYAENK
ncbi:MAG TPA: HAD-IIB family hydrolase [Bacteroidetes bacterium]|nr:HAD-IIB family hydrolase [Bacteroidota bacterium]